jgi:hypothetical protein
LGEISKWADENLRLFLRTVRRSKKCFSCWVHSWYVQVPDGTRHRIEGARVEAETPSRGLAFSTKTISCSTKSTRGINRLSQYQDKVTSAAKKIWSYNTGLCTPADSLEESESSTSTQQKHLLVLRILVFWLR